MTATQTLKLAFPRGHTSFSFYSGSVDLSAYDYAHIHDQDTKGNSLRVTLFADKTEAEQKHGDDIRKLYATHGNGPIEPGKKVYKTLTGPTKRFLGFEREKNYLFGRVHVPVHKISETPSTVTYDIDLTDGTTKALIKSGIRRGAGSKVSSKVKGEAAVAKAAKAETKPTVAKQSTAIVKPAAPKAVPQVTQKVHQLSLPAGTTIGDLRRMNFQVMIVDSNDNPFAIDIVG